MYKLEEFIHRTKPKKSMNVTLDKNLQISFSKAFFSRLSGKYQDTRLVADTRIFMK